MDPDLLSEALEASSSRDEAVRIRRRVRPLRGIRGVAMSEVAQLVAAAWAEDPIVLPDDASALGHLFSTAFEDGLVAIGLLAAALPDAPEEALEVGLEWASMVDDVETADALGWLVLGPAVLTTGGELATLPLLSHRRAAVRRAVVAGALALLPVPVSGPSAAALRERLGVRAVRFVDEPHSAAVQAVLDASWRDEAPEVRKAVRRVLRTWHGADREVASAWAGSVRGGLPVMLRDAIANKKKPRRRR